MERNAAWRPRAALLAAAVCVISARCGGTPRGAPSGEPTDRAAADTGFVATVTGAVQGKVAAPGVVKRLESDGGYYFISDDQGVRPVGVVLILPADAAPGTYDLTTAGPLDTGKSYQARLDHTVGNQVVSFGRHVRGRLTLDSFPATPRPVRGSRVRGRFEFSADDLEGSPVSVKGTFDFVQDGS